MMLTATEPHEHLVPVSDAAWGLEDDRRARTHRLTPDCVCRPEAYLHVVDGRRTGTQYRHNSFAALAEYENAMQTAELR